jgi:hypothetical protein
VTEPIRVWRKSSYSGADNGCVEILTPPPLGKAVVRDSKDPQHRRMIIFRAEAWAPFVHAYRTGGLVKAPTH